MADSPLDRLRGNPKNPRTITRAKAAALKKALKSFGDLGGIVFNRSSKQLLGGHQRIDAFRSDDNARVEITTTYQAPTRTGTVAEGYVFSQGERYSYREVEWDAKTEKAASIACNVSAGQFDVTGLTAWLNELNFAGFDMDATMFSAEELRPYLPDCKDLSLAPPKAAEPDLSQDTFDPSTGEAAKPQERQPEDDAAASYVKAVQLFFDERTYQKFLDLTDGLRDVYKKDNLSDTVFEAVKRASVSAALR